MSTDFAQAVKDADDDTLREFIGLAESELKLRGEQRKADAREKAQAILAKAAEEARAVLERVGLPFTPMKGGRPKRAAPKYHSGVCYQHPDEPTRRWNGRGVRPKWIVALERDGRSPVMAGSAETDARNGRHSSADRVGTGSRS